MESEKEKREILLRLRRIEGQIRGLQGMIEKGVSCPDILTQVAAATSAIKRVGTAMLQAYMEECLEKGREESGAKQRDTVKDFQRAISRYIDWA